MSIDYSIKGKQKMEEMINDEWLNIQRGNGTWYMVHGSSQRLVQVLVLW